MPQPWKLEHETPSPYQIFIDVFRSFRGVPLLAWVFLVLGLVLFLFTEGRATLDFPAAGAAPAQLPQATGFVQSLLLGWRHLPWLGMAHEISIAAIISF